MRLSLVFYAFLARMAVGTLCALLVVMRMRAAERHVRFQLVLALVLSSGAAALYDAALGDDVRPSWPRGWAAFASSEGAMPWGLALVGAGCLLANLLWGTFRRTAARVVLVATYELGRQPFGLASPAAWLRDAGHDVVAIDTSRDPLDRSLLDEARMVAWHLPMHTATRLALPQIAAVRSRAPNAHLCAYGL